MSDENQILIGNEQYRRAINECLPKHRELMVKVWTPTPWMIDVFTQGREHEMWQWCYQRFGRESSPIHDQEGSWMRSNVTMRGRTWFGFKNEAMMKMFESNFSSKGKS